MTQIKAIETYYNGYRFRSRLEARWAVFFDAMGINYEYELEGYELPNGMKYLPDFYLPDIDDGVYVEVKGDMDDDSYRKVEAFWKYGDKPLYTLGGLPTQDDLDRDDMYVYAEKYKHCLEYGGRDMWDHPYFFCVCPACGKVGIEFDGRGWRVCGIRHKDKDLATETYKDDDGVVYSFKHPEVKGWRTDDKGYSWSQSRLVNAYAKARQARFEHGETPVVNDVR